MARCIGAIHRYGHILIAPNPQSKEPYFDNAARDAVNGVAVLLAMTPGAPLHVGAIRSACLRPDYRQHLRGLVERAKREGF